MAMLMPGEMSGMPGEYGMTRQKSDRKRKLAEALRQEAIAPQGRMVGNTFVAPSITQYLASGLKGYQANEMERNADAEEKTIFDAKQKQMTDAQTAYMNALRPQQVQTGVDKQPFEPGQMDQFGSPMPGQQQATQPVMGTKQPTPQDLYMAQMQYAQATQNPELMMNAGNSIAQYQDKQQTRQEDRENKLFDVQDARKYEDIVRKDQQGFQLTQQERQFAQQFQLQAQGQGFQAGENAKNRNFQAGQNNLSRQQQMDLMNMKTGAATTGTPQAKINDAKDVLSILNQAAPLVNKSTGSGLGNLVDESAKFFGRSTGGAQAAAQLKALEGTLVSKMPKMSGPQSDKDVLLYKQMAGQIGDPTVPAAQKQAAMNTINELNSRYAGVPMQDLPYGNTTPGTPVQQLGGLPPMSGGVREVNW
jgi:hypothetical protein